jgi:predicted ATP-grasp superfamily ATP-dependent carboligase
LWFIDAMQKCALQQKSTVMLFGHGCRMFFRCFFSEAADVVHQNLKDHQLTVLVVGKLRSAPGIAGAAAAFMTYAHRSQLDSIKETMATKREVADVEGQIAEVKAQMFVLEQDIEALKDGTKEMSNKLKAKGK